MGRKCKQCKTEIPTVKACEDFIGKKGYCSIDCMSSHGLAKAKDAIAKKERKEHKARKEGLKTVRDWIKEAQKEFNRFIRLDDMGKPCISCDTPISEIEGNQGWKVGGAWDCGHYLTVGGHPELRFEPYNAHRQCKSCNAGSNKYGRKTKTVGETYRIKLIERIGIERVEWLEGPHEAKKYTIEQLKQIKADYRLKANELQKEINLIDQ